MLHRRAAGFLPAILAVCGLIVCGGAIELHAQSARSVCDTTGMSAAYLASVSQTAVYRHSDLRALFSVVPDSNGRVTVVTFTDYTGYKVGPYAFTGDRMLWVTVVPEVQQKCKQFTSCRLLRLQQLLGLPPGTATRQFVIMTVDVNDLFRPTPDPATGTRFPCSDSSKPDCGNAFPKNVYDLDHRLWIADNLMASYQLPNGYPWTHLGYTYNWAPDAADIYGASEYVIRAGSHVRIVAIKGMDDYCDGL